MHEDTRVITNVLDGRNQTSNDNNIWLTTYKNTKGHTQGNQTESDQLSKREPNYILIFFEQPIAISAIILWNYTKTPARGVNEFEVEIDGMKVFRGFAHQAPDTSDPSILQDTDWSTVLMFDSTPPQAERLAR